MENRYALQQKLPTTRPSVSKPLLVGVAGGLVAVTLLSMMRGQRSHSRRYADHAEERRNPMHFFLAGMNPRRREIDRSGRRPLFERRQSVYETY